MTLLVDPRAIVERGARRFICVQTPGTRQRGDERVRAARPFVV